MIHRLQAVTCSDAIFDAKQALASTQTVRHLTIEWLQRVITFREHGGAEPLVVIKIEQNFSKLDVITLFVATLGSDTQPLRQARSHFSAFIEKCRFDAVALWVPPLAK